MLLQMPTRGLKALNSPQLNLSVEPPRISLDMRCMETTLSPTDYRRFSWLPHSPSAPVPPEILTLRRTSSHAVSPTKPKSTATCITHSSSSSLYTQNIGRWPVSTDQHSLSAAQPPPPTIEPRVFPPLLPAKTPRKLTLWRPFPSIENPQERARNSTKATSKTVSRTARFESNSMSTVDDVEAIKTYTLDGFKTPTQKDFQPVSGEAKPKFSFEDVERLIIETDEAFRAVGTALEDAKSSTHIWHKRRANKAPRSSQDYGIGNMIKFTHGVSTAVATSTQSRPLQLVPRKKEIRTCWTKKEITPSKQPHNRSSRLRLREVTANVSDLLSGKVFRTEADELPNRKLPLRDLEDTRTKLVESVVSVETEGVTPTDPFHLEGLSSRIKAAQRMLSLPIYPPIQEPDMNSHYGNEASKYQTKPTPKLLSHVKTDAEKMIYNNRRFPSPPTTHHKLGTSSKNPERPSTPLNPSLRISTGEYGNIIALQSTPFTWTSPLFIHGPIKIEQAAQEQTFQSPQEEVLDWTAFQMAILGTMDPDGGDQRDDWEWEADERELDEIMDWWEGFGFEGIGSLEGPPPLPLKTASISLPRLQDDDKEVNSPPFYAADFALKETLSSGKSSPVSFKQGVAGAWSGNLRKENRSSIVDSLPPSPMLDLFVFTPTSEDGNVRIPMGFNLGHDLGDFLRWEAKHVQNLVGCQK